MISAHDALGLLPELPENPDAFAELPVVARVASVAVLKEFEQLQDTLNALFRTTLRALGVRLKGLYPLDIGHRMEELDVLDDADRWLAIVMLRNELVHEYPTEAVDRVARLRAAIGHFPFLFDAAARIERAIERHDLMKGQTS
ncbi:hypothetical protein QP166_10545 [Sphingomonas sp. LR60]|uniref:hypothetical protein n=1 Tax=Sphingomonas sp. LR60 TaxID=3050233 RepID=UPI002FE3DD93